MTNFIDNLVHKACGDSLLTKPEPSLMPGFEVFSQTPVFPEKRSPDEKLTVESLPVESSQDFPANSDESINALKTTSEELSSTSDIKFHASSEKTFQKPLKKTSIDVGGIPVQPEIAKLNKRIKGPPAPSKSNHEEASSKSVNISPVAGRQSLNLRDVEKPVPGKPVEHPEALASEFGWEKQTGHSISPEPQIGAQHDISNKFQKSQPESSVVDSEFQVCQPALEAPSAKKKSHLSRVGAVPVVNVEPGIEAWQQAFIKDLMIKTNRAAPPFGAEGRDLKTTESLHHKEVRVNIGCIEIKASQKAQRPMNPSARGFDDYLMMRLYLDRHYF
jgi:hypothetical protein